MNTTLRKELPIIALVLLPFIYLFFIWNKLPEIVPTHFNIRGEADGWGDKYDLILMLLLLPVLTYVLMLVIPKIDPKKRLQLMGGKFYQLKFVLVALMSIIALFIVYISKNQVISNPNFIAILTGVLFMALGNYFKVIKQNYFIGIKTPWALENEEVWNKTHRLAGKLWIIGGLLIIILNLTVPEPFNYYGFLIIIAVLLLVPTVYSYIFYKQLNISK